MSIATLVAAVLLSVLSVLSVSLQVAAQDYPNKIVRIFTLAPGGGSDVVAIVARLNRDVVRGLNRPEVKERFLHTGVEVAGGTPEEFSSKIKSDIAKFTQLVKESRIKEK